MTAQSNKDARHEHCPICSQLRGYERGLQVHGREEQDTFLPDAAERLKFARTLKARGCRVIQLSRCPQCETYYLFKSDYEYLATGSEDEQTLERLTDEKAAEYLAQPAPEE